MLLDFEQIKRITVGAVKTEEKADGYHFYKCTDAQTAAWYQISADLGDRSLCTTGVRLDFITNSKNFAFESSGGGKYELHVNSQLREQIFPSNEKEGKIVYSARLSNQRAEEMEEYRVTLIFPSHRASGVIQSVELDDGAYIRPCKYSKKILFLGDSITQGWQSEYDSLSYAYRVSSYFDAESVINGIGGAVFAESTFEKIDFDPDIVIIAYGTNDWGRYGKNSDNIMTHVRAYLNLIARAYAGKEVFVISPIWRCDSATGESMPALFDECRKSIESEARARGFHAVDGLSLVPPIRKFYADGYLHPNDIGFSLYSENLIKTIENTLKKN